MVSVNDPQTGTAFPGFEKERCVFMDTDSLRLPLRWNNFTGTTPPGPVLTGRHVSLRVYFRDSTVYAIGAEET